MMLAATQMRNAGRDFMYARPGHVVLHAFSMRTVRQNAADLHWNRSCGLCMIGAKSTLKPERARRLGAAVDSPACFTRPHGIGGQWINVHLGMSCCSGCTPWV